MIFVMPAMDAVNVNQVFVHHALMMVVGCVCAADVYTKILMMLNQHPTNVETNTTYALIATDSTESAPDIHTPEKSLILHVDFDRRLQQQCTVFVNDMIVWTMERHLHDLGTDICEVVVHCTCTIKMNQLHVGVFNRISMMHYGKHKISVNIHI